MIEINVNKSVLNSTVSAICSAMHAFDTFRVVTEYIKIENLEYIHSHCLSENKSNYLFSMNMPVTAMSGFKS